MGKGRPCSAPSLGLNGGIKESGLGREGIRFALEEMTEIRLMIIRGIL
jgi:acyl-CoA reductase-like NAD-dependent aldehyde dehydrogenase